MNLIEDHFIRPSLSFNAQGFLYIKKEENYHFKLYL